MKEGRKEGRNHSTTVRTGCGPKPNERVRPEGLESAPLFCLFGAVLHIGAGMSQITDRDLNIQSFFFFFFEAFYTQVLPIST